MAEITFSTEQKVHVALHLTTQYGSPVTPVAPPWWRKESGDGFIVEDPDGMGAYLRGSNTPGDTIYKVTVDGVEETIVAHITPPVVHDLGLVFGAPEENL